MTKLFSLTAVAVLSIATVSAHAETVRLKAALKGADEVPAKQVDAPALLQPRWIPTRTR